MRTADAPVASRAIDRKKGQGQVTPAEMVAAAGDDKRQHKK
jgi:hypothetical protein